MSEEKVQRKYALLMETSADECESWYSFILHNGNEEALQHLQKQLQTVDWVIEDGLSTFDLETTFLVSETTAKEMTKVDLNSYSFHRKFDGVLKKIDFNLRDTDSNKKKMKKIFKVLGYGQIEEFVDKEDIDPEDLVGSGGSGSEEPDSESDSESEEEEETETETESEEDSKDRKKKGTLPKIEIPRYAKAKKKAHKHT